ncbi:hybrid sensor histidine kinase/response regulator transcription factor [Marinilabilia rubra]|uniref:histidine kinase n=1 Tax=Marinilabilia rubra TaxID=2162893 RepID=A0A2U2BBB7_9BACT|nr:hybrid sensor histidine kinase/response regulator transcription factor [Marinilabilia rubra]PWE00327.1 hypothetical protein DDZ16_05145 [Marinilabilia rubra]
MFKEIILSIFFLSGFYILNISAGNRYSIQHIDTNNGLSQNEVTTIIQDKYGFMWFGTRGGLNRYDGYNFKLFKPGRDKQNSINNPSVERLYQDRKGNIWIGTKSGGLSIYDIEKASFTVPDINQQLPNRIIAFASQDDSSMLIGGGDGGLNNLNIKTDSVQHWLGNRRVSSIAQTPDSIIWCAAFDGLIYAKLGETFTTIKLQNGSNEVTEIIVGNQGEPFLWLVGWDLGLIRFNYQDFTFEQYQLPLNKSTLSPKAYSLMQDDLGDLWVGTWGNGIYKFDRQQKGFEQIDIEPKRNTGASIDYDVILDIFQDREGDIWIGTDGGGIVRLSDKSQFNTLGLELTGEPLNLHVNAIFKDANQNILIGTKGQGLFVSDDGKRLLKVGFQKNDRLFNKDELVVRGFFEDDNNNIWVGSNEGLYILSKNPKGSFELIPAALFFNSPQLWEVRKVHQILLNNDDLWVGTQQRGLYHYKFKDSTFQLIKNYVAKRKEGYLPTNRVTSVFVDHEEKLWLGTYKGLFQFQPEDSTFLPVEKQISNKRQPLSKIILCTWIDNDGTIWFGTPCSLNKLTKSEHGEAYDLTDYSRSNGLSDDYINALLSDEKGNVWISTNAGISMLHLEDNVFRNYDVSDGLGGSNFSESACFKASDGVLYFGGSSDVTFFHPNQIKENLTMPSVVITEFKILNKEVPIEQDGILSKSINEVDHLELTYKESEFSFEIAALDYKAPNRNQYAYWLEGSGEERVNIGTRRHISFSNLKPGDYTLHLYGTNSNGVWSEKARTLELGVLPAPWRTWYAVIIYFMLILFIVASITIVTRKQERLVNAVNLQRILREKEQSVNEYKLTFFTDISHELRTPLTLILAPIIELLKKDLASVPPAVASKKIQLVYQHATRLYNLVNQLLEFRKIEAGKIKLQVGNHNIVSFVADICEAFEELAETRNITFKKQLKLKEPELYFDIERLSVVVNNLLSNAFKFVGTPGQVEVLLSETKAEVNILIKNNGKGISDEDIKHLFERFYQATEKRSVGSSGIGLALVKNYVELHKGRVEVESKPGQFTTFSVILPKGRQHFSDDELLQSENNIDQVVAIQPLPVMKKSRSVNTGTKGAKLMLVEDNREVRSYLKDLLADEFEILEAEDGIEAFDLIIEHKPQIIISDVMMPGMDGFELCQKIKSNDTIAHIPVVLLTAKGTPQDQLFGARRGADLYLTKPFEPELIIEKVKQLVASRKLLSEKFSKQVKLEPTDAIIKSEEAEILEKAIKIIEKNIGDAGFDPDKLAGELAMSTSTFYRKIKKLTGKTPGEFIKSIRLKRAAQLLRETNLTVSEIIESVGYQDIKNFRYNFKQSFELTPTDYRKKFDMNV